MNCTKHGIPVDMCIACRIEVKDTIAMRERMERDSGQCTNPACQALRDHTRGLRDQFNKLVFVTEALLARHGDLATIYVNDARKEIGSRGLSFVDRQTKRGVEIRVKLVTQEVQDADDRRSKDVVTRPPKTNGGNSSGDTDNPTGD